MPFAPDCRIADRPERKYPRFTLRSIRLFILLVPAEEVRFAIDDKDSIVRGKTGLLFPSLPAFVQSLLDSKNMLDLADLIDAMNLNEEWATENGVKLPISFTQVLKNPRERLGRGTQGQDSHAWAGSMIQKYMRQGTGSIENEILGKLEIYDRPHYGLLVDP